MDNNLQNTIEKDPVITFHDEDYSYLRKAGLEYIEELGTKLWTDYNEHDPGITILEALCYAITELGYRSSLPIMDLLTEKNGTTASGQVLYTPAQILTQAPLTVNDYRKLLIDNEGVHNAWIFYGEYDEPNNTLSPIPQEVDLFADCKQDALSTNTTHHPIYLFGLYKVMLDLDTDSQFGDLNNGTLQVDNPKTNNIAVGDASLSFIFPAWNVLENEDLLKVKTDELNACRLFCGAATESNWAVTMQFIWNNTSYTTAGTVTVDLEPANSVLTQTDIENFFLSTGFAPMVIGLYLMKIQKAKKIIDDCKRVLMANRNLCEDFLSIDSIKDEEIGICCDIDVAAGADMEEVQAKVFLAVEEYLNPGIRFHLLNEMMDRYSVDEIFEGPKLKHGFIDTKELEQTQLREMIHASDIISAIMKIDGVQSVRGFRMTNYGSTGIPIPNQTGKEWCIPITKWHKPVLSETKSKIIFYKNRFPYLSSVKEVRDILRSLKSLELKNKLTGHEDDLSVPVGTYAPIENYTSVQTLFPLTYGIGETGLMASATDERKAEAKQLKAYLLFYDQLLADFFMQLRNAKELFSINTITHTYSAQYLNSSKNQDIYKTEGTDILLEALINDQNSGSSTFPASEWQGLYESKETYLDRRNRFLDHLMGRFAESFNDYTFLMYSLDYQTQQETKINEEEIIKSKTFFLTNYPEISYNRGLAFNYNPEIYNSQKKQFVADKSKYWDTENVSGLEKKLCLLGAFNAGTVPANMQTYYRRFLYCLGNITTIPGIIDPKKLRFVFTSGNNTLTSVKEYKNIAELNSSLPAFLSLAMAETNFCTKKEGTGTSSSPFIWNAYVTDKDCIALAKSNDFNSLDETKKAIKEFVKEFLNECDNQGLHLIEHILLRPRKTGFHLAPVCLDPDCDFCGEQDPYSFKMSIVIPYWPAHFRNMAFRDYFETLAKAETPAHIMIKICWIDDAEMYEFENSYKKWIPALAAYTQSPNDISSIQKFKLTNNTLLTILFKLHSKYPEASLHDCNESEDTNPVMLGRTVLGSFKN